jgi:hypothetical protein
MSINYKTLNSYLRTTKMKEEKKWGFETYYVKNEFCEVKITHLNKQAIMGTLVIPENKEVCISVLDGQIEFYANKVENHFTLYKNATIRLEPGFIYNIETNDNEAIILITSYFTKP